ncbi:MAG TPA: V-type ATP synthase subunit E family protein [Lachnospiraceae bacterium]
MTGLEQIISQIQEEAKDKTQEILSQAGQQAQQIIDSQTAETKEKLDRLQSEEQAWEEEYKEKLKSSKELQKRREILKAKQSLVEEVLKAAYERLANQEDDAYFAMIEKLLDKAVLPKEGHLYFSEKDLKRLPGDFRQRVDALAQSKGGSLQVMEEGKKIENGFILAYGGIEENYSLKALFNEKREKLQDKVCAVLFPC